MRLPFADLLPPQLVTLRLCGRFFDSMDQGSVPHGWAVPATLETLVFNKVPKLTSRALARFVAHPHWPPALRKLGLCDTAVYALPAPVPQTLEVLVLAGFKRGIEDLMPKVWVRTLPRSLCMLDLRRSKFDDLFGQALVEVVHEKFSVAELHF
ncbi:hypothetical protein GGF32_006017 [Allomyces javanicus]|nr:hypothetical protein GGF32_006017 [Allomyces javanicus]